ncbi:MAG: hypothetical protein NW218_18770 [Saprospiraceae bacterium]|nr:hypothetical protein [Saprospiraceae bacterium]
MHNPNLDDHPSEQPHVDSTLGEMPNVRKPDYFKRGLIWFGLGILCMAISFCITFFFFQSDGSSITFMYILTSVGVLCITKGLADLFGF